MFLPQLRYVRTSDTTLYDCRGRRRRLMFPKLRKLSLWRLRKENRDNECYVVWGYMWEICWRNRLVTLVKKVSLHEMAHEQRIVAGDLERQEKWRAEVPAEKEGGGLEGMERPC